jgi:aspartyl/asparaginyl beta-hydroxylase (cupin superfamily)
MLPEAWNDSDRERVVLLFDIWRPELTDEERALVTTVLTAARHYSGEDGQG